MQVPTDQVYQPSPAYNYQTMPYMENSAHNEIHLKVSNTPTVPYQSVKTPVQFIKAGVQMQRLPLIAAGYNTLTGDNKCHLQNVDADYYTLNNAYTF